MKKQRLLDIFAFLMVFAVMLCRMRYGIDFSDETWYVAEPYIVANGAVPYVDNWSQAAGFTLPFFVIIKAFCFLTGGTEGIILFARIFYILWETAMILVVYVILNKILKEKFPLFVTALFLFFGHFGLYYIDYNTIGPWYLLLADLLALGAEKSGNISKEILLGTVSGVLMARAILGTPAVAVSCIAVLGMLVFLRYGKRTLGYCLGGLGTALLTVGYCAVRGGGLHNLLIGLQIYLQEGAYLKIGHSVSFFWNVAYLGFMTMPFLLYMIVCKILYRHVKDLERLRRLCLYLLGCCMLLGVVICWISHRTFRIYIACTWFGSMTLWEVKRRTEKDKPPCFYVLLPMTYYILFLASSCMAYSGFSGREYILFIPCIFSYILFFKEMKKRMEKLAVLTGISTCAVLLTFHAYREVYRDLPISKLDTCVKSGIWKGCLTTKNRAADMVEVENYIRKITLQDDKVLFLDWTCYGYLMSDGEAFTPSVLDNMGFGYKINAANIMYDYFEVKGDIPNKIIYIAPTGGDLSIDYEDWTFNEFVHSFYYFAEEKSLGDARVLLYKRN